MGNKIALFLLLAGAAHAATRTTLDGVFTQEQADRGQAAYTRNCSGCHQRDLNGTGGAPALRTVTFTERWREGYLSNLFHHMQTWMPPQDRKGSLPEQQYLDIVTYVLSMNEFPAGAKELTKADLDTVLLVEQGGPKPLPPSSTVRVVGCLAHDADWSVTKVGETPRVNDGSDTYPSELAWSQRVPLGTQTYLLPDLEDDHKLVDLLKLVGKKVQVKGILKGQGANQRITTFSLEVLDGGGGSPCQ